MRRRRYPKGCTDKRAYDFAVSFACMRQKWLCEIAGDIENDRRDLLQNRLDIIRRASSVVDDATRPYLLRYACGEASIDELIAQGMPCGRDYIITAKKRFMLEIARAIK